jgi:hypothetical protein
MSTIKFFVSHTGNVIIECPQCSSSKEISVAACKGKIFSTKVKCRCGHIFPIKLDFRQHHRKHTLLDGNYQKTNLTIESYYEKLSPRTATVFQHPQIEAVNCTIVDLSAGGVGLNISGLHEIEEGDELFLQFNLDNKKKSLIKCAVTVKKVRGNLIGAEFKEGSDFNPELGFYLMS